MYRYYRLFWFGLLFVLALSGQVTAALAGEKSHGYDVTEAHVHGNAHLFVVLENEELLIEFQSPGMNLVGFEHDARTDKEKAELVRVHRLLKQGEDVLQLQGGRCEAMAVDVDIPGVQLIEHGEGHEHGEDGHSEIHAQYRFRCHKPDQLASIRLLLFEDFSDLESVDAQWVIRSQQGAATLTANQPVIELQ